jgi:hypothetical protein
MRLDESLCAGFRFPIEHYAEQIPPSQNIGKTIPLAEADHAFTL